MSTTVNGFNIIQPTINIGIIGCVSSGKSTTLNSIFCDTYSDMNIKRTTMTPQVYLCDPEIKQNKEYAKLIRTQNEEINRKIIELTENKKKLSIRHCSEQVYKVSPIENFINLPSNTNLAIFDIPGLNDSQTKNTYFQYLNENFYKFDYVLFVIDIYSGLNTSDEMDILKLIKKNINDIKRKYNKDIKLLVICNKCDNMELNKETNELKMDESELEEMYNQIVKTLQNEINDINYDIIKYSAEDTYIYRLLIHDCDLDDKYIDRLGNNEYGKVLWKKLRTSSTKEELIKNLKDQINIEERLNNTGYNDLITKINKSIGSISDILLSKISIIEDKIIKKEKNYNKVCDLFANIYNYVQEIKEINNNINIDDIFHNIKTYWHELLLSLNPFTIIDTTNYEKLKIDYYNVLLLCQKNFKDLKLDIYIKNYIKKETAYHIKNLDTIINTKYNIDTIIETLTIIYNNEGSLPLDKILNSIYKIRIEDIHQVITKLEDYKITTEKRANIYLTYFLNYKNYKCSDMKSIIKLEVLCNFYMKEYTKTELLWYNLLKVYINSFINIQSPVINSQSPVISDKIANFDFTSYKNLEDIRTYLEPHKLFVDYINMYHDTENLNNSSTNLNIF